MNTGLKSLLAGLGVAMVAARVAVAKPVPSGHKPGVEASTRGIAITVQIISGADGGRVGPDGKPHDTLMPSRLSIPTGKVVTLHIVNHDMMKHSIFQPELGMNIVAKPAKMARNGEMLPVTTTATFSVSTKGHYRWFCTRACDNDAGGWAMTSGASNSKDVSLPGQTGFMAGEIVAF